MTSLKQIQANRANALKSTGPITEEGKQRSRGNAVRHGLTAETVIGALEDAEHYKAFEAAVTADYDAQSAVERELVLRLASLLWRLRRATAVETGLFAMQAGKPGGCGLAKHVQPETREIVAKFRRPERWGLDPHPTSQRITNSADHSIASGPRSVHPVVDPTLELARSFLHLADLPTFALDRLSRYEATLWRQVGQVLFALEALDRRKPQERTRPFGVARRPGFSER
jgi:hypothetical protein